MMKKARGTGLIVVRVTLLYFGYSEYQSQRRWCITS